MIRVTSAAVNKVKELITSEKREGCGLRVAVQGGGCSGFQYGLSFEEHGGPNDHVLDFDGLKVYVDAMSGMYLEGAQIDYVDSPEGSGFKIDNPNTTGMCGCHGNEA